MLRTDDPERAACFRLAWRAWPVAAAVSALAALAPGCSIPNDCTEDALSNAALVESTAEGVYAQDAVKATLAKVAESRAAIAAQAQRFALMRNYRAVAPLCAEARSLAAEATAAIEQAKQRRAEFDALTARSNTALDDAGLALHSGRALLEVAPHPELDQMVTQIQKEHRSVNAAVNAALARMKESAWTEDLSILTAQKKALDDALLDSTETTREIRRRATEACAPATKDNLPLHIGPGRAWANGGVVIAQAGLSEEDAKGYVVVLTRSQDTCRVLDAGEVAAPDAVPSNIPVTTAHWNAGGAIPDDMVFLWSAPRAWFLGAAGRWSFDAASITGLSERCVGVKCAEPELGADDVVVSCSCINPKNPGDLPEDRWVRFSWRKGAIVAE